MTQHDRDVQTAINWLVDIAIELTKRAKAHDDYAGRLIDKVMVVTACAELPGDMPIRIRLFPHVFALQA